MHARPFTFTFLQPEKADHGKDNDTGIKGETHCLILQENRPFCKLSTTEGTEKDKGTITVKTK